MTNQYLYLSVGVPLVANVGLTVALALLNISNMKSKFEAVNKRFDDMRDLGRAELRRVEEVLSAIEALGTNLSQLAKSSLSGVIKGTAKTLPNACGDIVLVTVVEYAADGSFRDPF